MDVLLHHIADGLALQYVACLRQPCRLSFLRPLLSRVNCPQSRRPSSPNGPKKTIHCCHLKYCSFIYSKKEIYIVVTPLFRV